MSCRPLPLGAFLEDLALALTGVMTTSGGVGCMGVTTPGGV